MVRIWRKSRLGTVCIAGPVLLIGGLSYPAWGGLGTEQLKGTLDRVIAILNDPALKGADKRIERDEMLRKLMKARLDEVEISRRALGAHWQERTKEEKQEFVQVFSSLLERTYLGKIDAYLEKANGFSSENIHYLNEREGNGFLVVETEVTIDAQTEFPVNYLLKNKEGNWLVSDIAIEGVSIVKNYRAQFYEILARSSFEDLLAQLKAKERQ